MQSQQGFPKAFSFEFFPAKTADGEGALLQVAKELATVEPCFFSVTYGAAGSTRDRTAGAVFSIKEATGIDVSPHLTCIGSTRAFLRELLAEYKREGIRHLVALRGDLPEGTEDPREFNYANELIEFVRKETGDHFFIEVAAYPEFHPQASSAKEDLANFKRKVNAGADSALTQYFFNADAYFRFVDSCEKLNIDLPIVPGIMPITNYKQLARFSGFCGAEIPRWIAKRLECYGDDLDSIKGFGEEVMTEMCQRLLDSGAPGLHFYSMNKSEACLAIWNNLGITTQKS